MPVSRDLVSIGELKTQDETTGAGWIAVQDGDLRTGSKTRRRQIAHTRAPAACDSMVGGSMIGAAG